MERAIVIGASAAGLLAARMLARHAGDVVVLERDDLSLEGGPRRGIPQAPHLHGLLTRGQRSLERYFPGIRDELVGRGAVLFDPPDALGLRLRSNGGDRGRRRLRLRERLAAHEADLPERRPIAGKKALVDFERIVDSVWSMTTAEDFRHACTTGVRPLGLRFVHAYLDRIHAASLHHPEVLKAFDRSVNLEDFGESLFDPRIAYRALSARLPTKPPTHVDVPRHGGTPPTDGGSRGSMPPLLGPSVTA